MKHIISCFFTCCVLIAICSCEKESELVNPDDSGSYKLKISLDKEELTLEVGKTSQLVASFTPNDTENKAHEWSSSDSKVATVDAKGLVKAVAIGTANITAKSLATGATATCVVTVIEKVIPVSNVKLNKTKESILVGETLKLEATVSPENASDKKITWSSSDNTVATVDEDGTVRGLQAGTSDIIAKTTNDKTAKCIVTVENPTVEFSDLKVFNIDETSAEVSFSIVTKGVNPTEIGVCYDPEKTPTIESSCVKSDSSKSEYTCKINNLQSNTYYYLRVYAKDGSNIFYSSTSEFKTNEAINWDNVEFKIEAIYNDEITFTIKNIDFEKNNINVCYGIAPHPEVTDNVISGKSFLECKNLKPATTYYFRLYSENKGKITYYDVEKTASTLGIEGQKITASCIGEFAWATIESYALFKIDYDLPEGLYYTISGEAHLYKEKPTGYIHDVYKSNSHVKELYFNGGKGTFYLIAKGSWGISHFKLMIWYKDDKEPNYYIFKK